MYQALRSSLFWCGIMIFINTRTPYALMINKEKTTLLTPKSFCLHLYHYYVYNFLGTHIRIWLLWISDQPFLCWLQNAHNNSPIFVFHFEFKSMKGRYSCHTKCHSFKKFSLAFMLKCDFQLNDLLKSFQ